uniref:Thioredoxin-interacting protein n=1 Tax=Mola mola TaxID=94237 RepID=A0A3Q4BAH1_MOLML
VLSAAHKLAVFRLLLSDPGRSFYTSGDNLSGCARVDHRGGKHRRSRSQEVEYLKHEEALRLEEVLPRVADTSGSKRVIRIIPGKTYSFQFGFELLAAGRLVSSYRGKFGCVRYYVRAVLDGPSQHALQCERQFEAEEPRDVNRPDLLAPGAASRQKKVTRIFVPDGQVSVSAQIDRKGFCQGEDISINAKFENNCSRIVVPKAAIIAKHVYTAEGHTKVARRCLLCSPFQKRHTSVKVECRVQTSLLKRFVWLKERTGLRNSSPNCDFIIPAFVRVPFVEAWRDAVVSNHPLPPMLLDKKTDFKVVQHPLYWPPPPCSKPTHRTTTTQLPVTSQ